MFHRSSVLFNHQGFQEEAVYLHQLIQHSQLEVAQNHIEQIYQKVCKQPKHGLYHLGEPLRPFETLIGNPSLPSTIGQWFMLVLSQYVSIPVNQVGYFGSLPDLHLLQLDWTIEELTLLIEGHPTPKLLGCNEVLPKILTHSDPYWYWIRPGYSNGHGGWLSFEDCQFFFNKLMASRHFIQKAENISQDQKLKYDQITLLFKEACYFKCGLYMALYQYSPEDDLSLDLDD